MKPIMVALLLTMFSLSAFAKDVYVKGYVKKDGTVVEPYHRSGPDNSYNNNWNTQGNTNPYTGQQGQNKPTLDDKAPAKKW